LRRPVSIFTLLFLSMTWIWSAGTARGEEDRTSESLFKGPAPWEISAETLTYDADGQTIMAQGDVVISREGQFLYAQEALYNRETGVAEVRGDVRLEIGEDVLTGRAATFDLNTQTGEVIDGRLFIRENHYYIDADRVEKLPGDSYLLDNARVTTCDGETPDWSITGSRVEVTLEGYGTIRNAAFRIRQVPFLYVPYLIFPAKRERQTGVLPPSFSYSSLSGAEIEVPFFWAVSNWTDATFYQRYLAERGYMQGLEYRYVAEEDSKGIFLFDILSDSKRKDLTEPDDVRISPFERTNRTRYWLRGMGDQSLPYGIDARLTADYVSDQDYLREFQKGMIGFEARPDLPLEFGRPVDERRAPLRRSALRLSRDGAGYSLQGLAAYSQRPEDPDPDETPQPIVGVNYSLLPGQVSELPMFVSLDSEFDNIWREVGTQGQRLSLSPEARFPLLQGPYLELEPSLRYFLTAQRLKMRPGGTLKTSMPMKQKCGC
jgi:LPS-assembly protein